MGRFASPLVAVGALGGTISMATPGGGGAIVPTLGAAELVESSPDLAGIARITATTLANSPSPSITLDDVRAALAFAHHSVDDGAAGVVLTHGTDTIEETAYLLDLLWDREEPLVLTGAMRSSSQLGADGASNLRDAVILAGSDDARGLGVLVAFAGEVHTAARVAKSHSTSVGAFTSPGWGPIGVIREDAVRIALRPIRRAAALPAGFRSDARVPIIELGIGDDGTFINAAAAAGTDGIVIAGAGAGHVPEAALGEIDAAIAAGTPVVLATRTGAGSTLTRTYGYPGGEEDLIRRGVIMAGFLSPRKARLLALVLADQPREVLLREFAARGA